jgi:PmbA protein
MASSPFAHPRPGLLGEQRAQALLESVLRAAPTAEVEASLTTSAEALTRFAHSAIHQNVAEFDAELDIRVALGRRVGSAATNDLSRAGIERAVALATTEAQHVPEQPDWLGLPDPAHLPAGDQAPLAFDEAVASASPLSRAALVGELCRAATGNGLLASGALSTSYGETALLNSRGLWAYAPSTEVDLTFVLEQPAQGASAYGHATGWRLDQLDAPRLTADAVRRALAGRQPRRVPAGEYAVVLDPYAVVPLLDALAEAGMGALAVQEARSWMNGRLGRPCLSPQLTIVDDAFDPAGLPRAFDCEGVPKQRVPIVTHGTPTSPVYDRATAAREPGQRSTGHAQPYDAEDWDGPLPENLAVEAGEATLDELVATVERGLYITRVWYVNMVAPHDCAVTGTTRDGVWWIENGELAYPAHNLRFDQSLVEALAGLRGVGRERRTVAGYFGGVARVPALALDSFRFIDP